MLSEDLIAELGEDAVLLPQNKSEKKRKIEDEPEIDPKLTKQQKRKLDGILKRKEKESKRDIYLGTLEKYQISSTQRSLMLSTRDVGQKMSIKKHLKLLYNKYKAGMKLNEDEMELLFPHKSYEQNGEFPPELSDDIIDDTFTSNPYITNPDNPSINEPVEEDMDIPLLDLRSTLSKTNGNKSTVLASKKKSKKSLQNKDKDSDNVSNTIGSDVYQSGSPMNTTVAETVSIGSKMMLQLANLKKLKQENSIADKQQQETMAIMNQINDEVETISKYIPTLTEIPITVHGISTSHAEHELKNTNNAKKKVMQIGSVGHSFIKIARESNIQAARLNLPVCGMEQEIVEAIYENDVVILCGETGSGKSTQVPQFLYEAGYGLEGYIGITQPRRVAATSTAVRVAYEMGQTNISIAEKLVGYHIRHDKKTIGPKCQIIFATDGILLREVTADLLLRQYSVVILDEAHERNINTDILIGLLSRSVLLRKQAANEELQKYLSLSKIEREKSVQPIKPLKLIIMSATLRIDDFLQTNLFSKIPPVIKVENRQFSVTSHFSKRTELVNYLEETFSKIVKIHKKLPEGGILVFLTGKREILHMCRRLNSILNKEKTRNKLKNLYEEDNQQGENSEIGVELSRNRDDDEIFGDILDSYDQISSNNKHGNDNNDDDYYEEVDEDESIMSNSSNDNANKDDEINNEQGDKSDVKAAMLRAALGFSTQRDSHHTNDPATSNPLLIDQDVTTTSAIPKKAYILPLFAVMSAEQQALVFQDPPIGHRLIVIATNVAETSITIPGIKYVVDSGRQKERVFSPSGISKFEVKWISKASAEQRAGRAGRVGPGHCYRLYSSAFYDQHMQLFQEPEICTTPLEDVLLQMRSLGIQDVEAFPFPTPPPQQKLRQALRLLVNIGAISKTRANQQLVPTSTSTTSQQKKEETRVLSNSGGKLTELGKLLAKFPLNPRLSKILILAQQSGLLAHGLTLIATLAEKSPFASGNNEKVQLNEDSDIDSSNEADETAEEGEEKVIYNLHYHPESDALARLRAFGAYLYTVHTVKTPQEVTEFCEKQNLLHTSLERMVDLRKQLSFLCSQVFPVDNTINLNINNDRITKNTSQLNMGQNLLLSPPTQQEETALRQLLLGGYCDCIARKAPILKEGSRRMKLTAYYSCNADITVPIYIHPSSTLYNKDPTASLPEFLLYTDLLENVTGTYTYMSCVTEISSAWIPALTRNSPLLRWSAPLVSPLPYYNAKDDEIMCYLVPKYGALNWELPVVQRSMRLSLTAEYDNYSAPTTSANIASEKNTCIGFRKDDLIYRWFARLLLEGVIL